MRVPPQAIVLAAGLGTRLWPLTCDRAKPAVPFLGKPLVAGVVEHLVRHAITRPVVNTHYLPQSIHAALRGVDVAFSHEPIILGTAGCIRGAIDQGLLDADRTTLIVNGKLHTEIDLSAAIDAHRASGAAVTMVVRPNSDRAAFREVLVDGDRVLGFGSDVVPSGPSPLLFTGIHLLEPEVIAKIPRGPSDTIRDTYPPFIARGQVRTHIDTTARWWEFSTLDRYLSLHQEAARAGLGPSVCAAASATIDASATVSASVLWEDAHVEGDAVLDQVIVGSGVRIPKGAHLLRTAVVRRDVVPNIERGEVRGDLVYVPIA